jgi:D-3-phosphoglycerate dehydrogenase / 2-oxoglutarate reductase
MKKKVVRFNFCLNPVFDEQIKGVADIDLSVLSYDEDDKKHMDVFKEATVYHINAARHEVPKQWWVTEDLLKQSPNLLCASSSGAGYDPIDLEACNRHGVLVVNQCGCNADSVAEHTLGLLLSVKHRITECDRVMRAAAYTTREDLMGHEIRGLTIGIVGVGNIGRRVSVLAKAFGLKVIGHDPYLEDDEIKNRGATPVSFNTLLAEADVVSVHCPLTQETLNYFGKEQYHAMKERAVFLSTARGRIHDEMALYEALCDGHLSGAGLDVWSIEPPKKDNPLLLLPNVTVTFHTAGVTHEARRNGAAMAADQIKTMLRGERPPHIINPEVWPVYLERFKVLFSAL